MLYGDIDQHVRQLRVSLRDETGEVLKAQQVVMQRKKIHKFFQRLAGEP